MRSNRMIPLLLHIESHELILVGDLAELFGCVIGMPDLLTAISFVALGTSLPDPRLLLRFWLG